jgi:hypothetical protein
MRSLRYGWLLIFLFLTALSWGKQTSQQAPAPQATRDPQAVAALQQAVAAMGAALPSDSVATGSVIVVAGTETDQGTIRILTRGTDQTLEQTDTPQAVRTEVFSQGQASETVGTAATPFPLERAATAQCRDFPLPYLLALLNNSEESLTFVGTEQLGVSALHIRATKTFLPLKVAHVQRDGGGSAPRTRMEIFFTDYQSTGGVLYPRTIRKSWNGTPWMTITVQTVSYNTGLTDANFPVAEVPQ